MALGQTRRPTRLSNPSLEDTDNSEFRGFGNYNRLLGQGRVGLFFVPRCGPA